MNANWQRFNTALYEAEGILHVFLFVGVVILLIVLR